jgi:hypothetical protein
LAAWSSLALGLGVAAAAEDLEHPAAWGDTHVGDPLPAYTEGKDCLFCHRGDIAPGWQSNAHLLSIRDVASDSPVVEEARKRFLAAGLALDVQAVLGGDQVMRFLRPNGNDSQYSILTASWLRTDDPAGTLIDTAGAHWDDRLYGTRCAGCHSTAVGTRSRAFSSSSVDCFSCHGVVDPKHSSDTSLILLSSMRADEPRVVVSLCGQCHVRSGHSLSTRRPYPNQFVPGDNLFRDLSIDLSDTALAAVNPIDRHVLENVRDVAVYGSSTTCLSCHDVHDASSLKHQKLGSADACGTCHEREGGRWLAKSYEKSSATCRYGAEWELAKIEIVRLEQEAIVAAGEQRVKRAIAKFLGLARDRGAEGTEELDESDAREAELP